MTVKYGLRRLTNAMFCELVSIYDNSNIVDAASAATFDSLTNLARHNVESHFYDKDENYK
jgi:exosome complex RNA-binding protein Rrp42 (RNase PH superfamily)